jgi:hypothetical protein
MTRLRIAVVVLAILMLAILASSQGGQYGGGQYGGGQFGGGGFRGGGDDSVAHNDNGVGGSHHGRSGPPEAEFHFGRLKYSTYAFGGSHGFKQPFWAVDYPLAEEHFLAALKRMSIINTAEDSQHLAAADPRLFEYPFLFMQQPGRGGWNPTTEECLRLREYFDRGGFMLVDDFHGDYEWQVFQAGMARIFPDRPIVDIPATDALMHVFFDLDPTVPIPGRRHIRPGPNGPTIALPQPGCNRCMAGPPTWRGIYDEAGRLMVAMNFNMDMGDSWEHADDPEYPMINTGHGYRMGTNYIIYSMTH